MALVKVSDLPIPKQQIHCEVAGSSKEIDYTLIYPDTKVRDFIASYLYWSHGRTSNSFSRLTCGTGKLKKCTWQFGESKSEEGWDRILNFTYYQNTNSVIPNSLECIDVP